MPPFNDIYVATADRSQACIDKFLSKYADLTTDKALADYFEVYNGNECVETGTLATTISYALTDTKRRAVVYLDSSISKMESVMLFFAPDGKLVLGLSIEYNENSNEEAERVLALLKNDFDTSLGAIFFETPPGEAYECMKETSGKL